MNLPIKKRVGAAVLALVLTAGVAGTVFQTWAEASNIPSKTVMQSGVTVLSNAKAAVDTSNLSEGFIQVKYTGGKNVRIKVQITKSGGTTYTYNLNNTGSYEIGRAHV